MPSESIILYTANHVIARVPSIAARLRYYRRVLGYSIGAHTAVLLGARFYAVGGLRIGAHSIVHGASRLDSRGGLTIGENVSISERVTILTADRDVMRPGFAYRTRPVVVEDFAFIGAGALILPGVTIGRGAIVGAGSVVARSVPERGVHLGTTLRTGRERPEAALDYTIDSFPALM